MALTESQKAEIRIAQEAKEAKLLADILAAHPGLTKEQALEMLEAFGF